MTSYDVKALFTSVPMDLSINTVKQQLQQDPLLSQRTMSIPQIITLLEFCLKTHTSSSKVSITNRSMVLPLVTPLASLLPTYLWKSLKSRPLDLPHTPTCMAKVCGWHHFHPEAKHSQQLCNTSTHRTHVYSSAQGNQTKKEPYHSWTSLFLQVLTTL